MACEIKFSRYWAMPSHETYIIKPIKQLLANYKVASEGWWIDPFAGNNSPASNKNDLDPNVSVVSHLDALDYLKSIPDNSHNGCLFDPPYSPRQVSECYKKFGMTVNMQTTQASYWRKLKDEIQRIVKPNGLVISFGWNTNGMGLKRGFEIEEIMLVAHGSNHNDTIVTVEKKVNAITKDKLEGL